MLSLYSKEWKCSVYKIPFTIRKALILWTCWRTGVSCLKKLAKHLRYECLKVSDFPTSSLYPISPYIFHNITYGLEGPGKNVLLYSRRASTRARFFVGPYYVIILIV